MRAARALGLVLLLLSAALLAVACGSDGSEGDTDLPTELSRDALVAVAQDFLGDRPGGASVHVVRGGQTYRAAVGAADNTDRALDPDTPLLVGSITKTLVATMVVQMADDGLLALDDRLGDHLPATPMGADATIRDLLSHRSGLPNYTDVATFGQRIFLDRDTALAAQDVLGYAADGEATPAGRFFYSNTNYILLGQLIERVDGRKLNQSLSVRVTDPLGLDHTSFALDSPLPDGAAAGWSREFGLQGGTDAALTALLSSAWAAGAVVSTPAELATIIQALLSGRLTSDAGLAAMSDTGDANYGLGLVRIDLIDGAVGYGHGGAIPGFNSFMVGRGGGGDSLVVVTNNDDLAAAKLAERVAELEPPDSVGR